MTLEHIGDKTFTHLSIEIDVLDPEWAPSTISPFSGGLTLDDGIYIARRVRETGSFVAMDLVEVNPSVESAKLEFTLRSGCAHSSKVLCVEVSNNRTLCGWSLRQYQLVGKEMKRI